jgi:hypothetical protein
MRMKSRVVRASRRGSAGSVDYSRETLTRLARVLVYSGHSPSVLVKLFRNICGQLRQPARRWDPTSLTYFVDLPQVVALWHSDPQYLDSRGAPLPLPFSGRGPSLCALIERVLPDEDPKAVAQTLSRMQAIRRRAGRYVPTERHVVYRRNSARVHSLNALLGMLRTVERNVAGPKKAAILERAATNPNFPVSALPAFHRRLKTKAGEFLWDTYGDMRRRSATNARGPRTRLGVGIFAFEDPILPLPAVRKPGAPRKRHAPSRRRAARRGGR